MTTELTQTPLNMFMNEDDSADEFAPPMSFTTTARAKWEIGMYVYDTHADYRPKDGTEWVSKAKFFAYPPMSNKGTRDKVYADAQDYIAKENVMDKKGNLRKPYKGLYLTIDGSVVPSHPDGRFEWGNSHEFINMTFGSLNAHAVNEYISNLSGPKPVGEFVWCKIERIDDPERTEKGETRTIPKKDEEGNAMYDDNGKAITMEVNYQIQVPIASYATQEEAMADMDSQETNAPFELSDTAKATYKSVAELQGYKSEIEAGIKAYVAGEKMAMEPKALDPMSEDEAISKVSDKYNLAISDVKNLLGL